MRLMKKSVILVAALALVAGACGDDDDSADSTTAATEAPAATDVPRGPTPRDRGLLQRAPAEVPGHLGLRSGERGRDRGCD